MIPSCRWTGGVVCHGAWAAAGTTAPPSRTIARTRRHPPNALPIVPPALLLRPSDITVASCYLRYSSCHHITKAATAAQSAQPGAAKEAAVIGESDAVFRCDDRGVDEVQ